MVKKAISTTRKKKAEDKLGQKAEWLIERGNEIIKRLEVKYNRTEQENIVPKQWQKVIIKSLNKKGNSEELRKNQRSLSY